MLDDFAEHGMRLAESRAVAGVGAYGPSDETSANLVDRIVPTVSGGVDDIRRGVGLRRHGTST